LDSDDPIVIDMDAPMDEDPKESEPTEKENEDGKGNKNKASEKLDDKGTKASGMASEKPADPAAKALNAKVQSQPIEQQMVVSDNSSGANKPIVILTLIGAAEVGGKLCKASSMSTGNNSRDKYRVLKEGTVSPVRSSKRTASFSSQESLERASKVKASRNLEGTTSKGKGSKIASFNTFDVSTFLTNTNQLGVSLGNSVPEIESSVDFLRELESSRLAEAEQSSTRKLNNALDDGQSMGSEGDILDFEALNLICAEAAEVLGDGGCDPVCLRSPVSQKPRPKRKK